MLFFDLSKKNIAVMFSITCALLLAVSSSLALDDKLALSDRAIVWLRYARHTTLYAALHRGNNPDKYEFNTNMASAAVALNDALGTNLSYVAQEAQAQTAQSIPVLVYHGVNDGGEDISTATFVDHMYALKRNGWQTVTLADFEAFMRGEKALPDKSFLLTFDDGIKDSYYPIDPVLADLGYSAVMFVITRQNLLWDHEVPSRYYLSPLEIEYMKKSGRWDIESHGRDNHGYVVVDRYGNKGNYLSNKIWSRQEQKLESDEEFAARIEGDLRAAKRDIENFLGEPVTAYAFPFGDFGQLSINFTGAEDMIVNDIIPNIYDFAFYQVYISKGDTFNYPNENEHMIKRVEPKASWSGQDLVERFSHGRAKQTPYFAEEFGKEWISTWGAITHGDTLYLEATESSSGASAFLDGSYLWKDYTVTATADMPKKGTSIVLIARHKDSDNYLSCAFTDNRTYVKEQRDGESITHSSRAHTLRANEENKVTLSMSVDGNMTTCGVAGEDVVSVNVGDRLEKGGVGLYVWNREQGKARAAIHDMAVE